MRLEQRIVNLEYENRARKASYPVVGSLVDFVSQTSPTYSTGYVGSETINKRIKFTGNVSKDVLVTLLPQVSFDSDFSTSYPIVFYINEPQTGDGSVIISINVNPPDDSGTFYFRALSIGSTTGTFTLL